MIYTTDHPRRIKNYIPEHILVMEAKIGRPLRKGECVHHLDGTHDNNDPNNLVLCSSASEHMRIFHAEVGIKTRFKKGHKNGRKKGSKNKNRDSCLVLREDKHGQI